MKEKQLSRWLKIGKLGIIVLAIVLLLIVGLGVELYQLYSVYGNIEVVESKVVGFSVKGLPVPSEVIIIFRIIVHNPTEYSITIEKFYYEIYVEDTFLTSGQKENINIPPGITNIDLDIHVTAYDAIKVLLGIFSEGAGEMYWKVRGKVTIPIKLFGLIKVFSIDVPYDAEGTYTLTLSKTEEYFPSTMQPSITMEAVEFQIKHEIVY